MTLPGAIDSDLQRNAALSMYEYLVLAALSETPDGMLQMSDLAHQANSSLSRLSHLISRLEKRGWVTKRPCQNDRRASTVSLASVKGPPSWQEHGTGLVRSRGRVVMVTRTSRPRQLVGVSASVGEGGSGVLARWLAC